MLNSFTANPPGPRRQQSKACFSNVCRLALFLLALWPCLGHGADENEKFSIASMDTRLVDGVYYLDAEASFPLSEAAIEALQNGVTISLALELEVFSLNWGWWKESFATLEQIYEIRFHGLTQHFVLKNANASTQESFETLSALLNHIRYVRDLPVIDKNLLAADTQYLLRARTLLLIDELPLPLRTMAYLSRQWRLKSDWYTWPLDD